MELKNFKTCNGCRAYDTSINMFGRCGLGFKIASGKLNGYFVTIGKPLEPCFKPKTYSQYISASEIKKHSAKDK